MTVEVKKTEDLKIGENYALKVLNYGKSGTGKSRAIRTLHLPAFVIDTDQGELVNRGVKGIDYVEIPPDPGWGLPKAFQAVKEALTYFEANKDKYKTLVFDSWSTIMEAALEWTLYMNKHQTKAATLPDYNEEMKISRGELMRAFGCGKNIYVVAHEESEKTDMGGQLYYLPSARGQMAPRFPIRFDETYHSEVVKNITTGKTDFIWRVRSSEMFVAKSRLAEGKYFEDTVVQDFTAYAKLCGVELK
jgi:phage nucleotide-binding protein